MTKQLDEDMMKMMSITERFKYIAAKKQMMRDMGKEWPKPLDVDEDKWCNYSGMPSPKAYEQNVTQSTNHEWVDRDNDEYDSSSDGEDRRGGEDYDDSNEY